MSNKKQSVGWAVCALVIDGICTGEDGTQRYQPVVENAAFHRQKAPNERPNNDTDKIFPCRLIEKILLLKRQQRH